MNTLFTSTRRKSWHSQDVSFKCSFQSILSTMDRFVEAVNHMDSTVLMPSRLHDMDVINKNSKFSKCLPDSLNNVDAYRFYQMLKKAKKDMLRGYISAVEYKAVPPSSDRSSPRRISQVTKHIFQPSDDSLGTTGYISDQEVDSDIESAVTDMDSMDEHSFTLQSEDYLVNAFRYHLQGLRTILHEFTDSADFLSARYQEEIENLSA